MAANKEYKEIYITKDVARFSFIWYENGGTIANCFRNSNTVEKKNWEKYDTAWILKTKQFHIVISKIILLFYILHPACHCNSTTVPQKPIHIKDTINQWMLIANVNWKPFYV